MRCPRSWAGLALLACLFACQPQSETDSRDAAWETELRSRLERIAQGNARYNAFITIDAPGALAAARRLHEAQRRGAAVGALDGFTVAVKDNIAVAGLPNTAGTEGLRDFVPQRSASVVSQLQAAGAVIVGKTNMHELAFGITSNNAAFGAVGNAHDPRYMAGGSSGGSAVAVAVGWVRASLCTDTGGSCRIPAAHNGVVGFRPTVGRYPMDGVVPLSRTRDTVGVIARSVADVVLLDATLSGERGMPPVLALDGIRLGVPRAYFYQNLDAGLAGLVEVALAKLARAGVTLVDANLDGVAEWNEKTSFPVVLYETGELLPQYLTEHHIPLSFAQLHAKVASPDVRAVLGGVLAGNIPEASYRQALNEARPRLQRLYAAYFTRHAVDAVVFPSTPLPARPIRGNDETVPLNGQRVPTFQTYIRNTDPGSNAGIPGLTVPIGRNDDGMPVGLAIDGPAGSDRRLLSIGQALERALADGAP